jgi:NADH-quinone oxidoreductase subunit G
LTEAANTVGAQLVGAMPQKSGLNAAQMLEQPLKAYLLLNIEPELDATQGAAALAVLEKSEMVVALSAFRSETATTYADVLLPIAPFTETSGTFVNAEGRAQSFVGVVRPLGETRPAWKVLRVLGNLLGLSGFDYETSEAVKLMALGTDDLKTRLSNHPNGRNKMPPPSSSKQAPGPALQLERIADVPIYATDPLVRRAFALQQTTDARKAARVSLPQHLWDKLALQPGAQIRVSQQGASADGHNKDETTAVSIVLPAVLDAHLPNNTVRIPAGLSQTAALGSGLFTLERVEAPSH